MKGSRARIREASSTLLREVSVTELRGLPSLPLADLDERLERQRAIGEGHWTTAQRREAVIREAMIGDGRSTLRIAAAAQTLGLSERTIQRLIDEAIKLRYLVRPRTPMEEVYKEVKRQCHQHNLAVPARNSIIKRIRALGPRLAARRRMGAKDAEPVAL